MFVCVFLRLSSFGVGFDFLICCYLPLFAYHLVGLIIKELSPPWNLNHKHSNKKARNERNLCIFPFSWQQRNETLENLSLKRNPEICDFYSFWNNFLFSSVDAVNFNIFFFLKLAKGTIGLANKEHNLSDYLFQNSFTGGRS